MYYFVESNQLYRVKNTIIPIVSKIKEAKNALHAATHLPERLI